MLYKSEYVGKVGSFLGRSVVPFHRVAKKAEYSTSDEPSE
jgi:hypothetical protein